MDFNQPLRKKERSHTASPDLLCSYVYCLLHRSWSAAVVKSGGVPRHIAIIMDGNRRYARQQHLERIEGHVRGFDKLKEVG